MPFAVSCRIVCGFSHSGQLPCGFLQIRALAESEYVPFMQPCGAGLLFAPGVVSEKAFQRNDLQTAQNVVYGGDSRTGRRSAGCGSGAFDGFDRTVVEIDQKRFGRRIGGGVDDLGRRSLRGSTPPALLSVSGSVVQPANSRNDAKMSSFLLFINYDFG